MQTRNHRSERKFYIRMIQIVQKSNCINFGVWFERNQMNFGLYKTVLNYSQN